MRLTASIAFAVTLALAAPAWAGPPIARAAHRPESVRGIAVAVAPDRIQSSVDIGRVARDTMGGWLGYILDRKADVLTTNAEDRADSALRPLARALGDFDLRPLALATSQRAFAQVSWLRQAEVAAVPSIDLARVSAVAAGQSAPHILLARYRLQTSPDFTQLQLVADIALADAKTLKPLADETLVSIVELNERSYDHAPNAARWAADDARIARAAIAKAFARIETALPRVLALTPQEHNRTTDAKHTPPVFAAGFRGPLLFKDEIGPVLWSKGDGFIAVQPAGD